MDVLTNLITTMNTWIWKWYVHLVHLVACIVHSYLHFRNDTLFLKSNYFTNIKFRFSKKATKIDEIFTVDLTITTCCSNQWRWRFCQFFWPSQKTWTLILSRSWNELTFLFFRMSYIVILAIMLRMSSWI